MFFLDWYELSQEETEKQRAYVYYNNELLQLDYSLKNLQTLREYKKALSDRYQKSLNNEKLQNDLREWR